MIPNRFHFVFGLKRQTEPFHLAHYLCLASCFAVNQPEAVYFYYQFEPYGKYWELIKDRLILIKVQPSSFIDQYSYSDPVVRKYRYAHAADFIRLEKLLDQGGIYADMDTVFVNPIPNALHEKSFVLGRENDVVDPVTGQASPSLCNAFIMAERNAPFGRLWLDAQNQEFDGSWSRHSTLLPYKLAQQHPDLIHIEPPRTFYKHMWTQEGLETLFKQCDADFDGVISMHLWAHLWWSRWRRDFTDFHAGRLTEKFILNVDTTYNLAARRHLPPCETFGQWWKRQMPKTEFLIDRFRHLGLLAFVLTKLVAFNILNDRIFPNASVHLDYAKRQWQNRSSKISRCTAWEKENIVGAVALFDEYGLRNTQFTANDIIIDIGAHVGIFADLCYQRGARQIHVYEPELDNFRRLAGLSANMDGVHLYNLAVFRSDTPAEMTLTHSCHLSENSGGGNVLFNGKHFESDTQTLIQPKKVQHASTISLDEILDKFQYVRLLKLDCEGSEFPILLTSKRLEWVQEIVLEYHECLATLYAELDQRAQIPGYNAFTANDLKIWLEQCGFLVQLQPDSNHRGLLHAQRQT